MPKKETPQKIALTAQEVEVLKTRISKSQLADDDIEIILGLLSFTLWIQDQLSHAKFNLKRLRRLFGFSSESRKKSKDHEASASTSSTDEPNDSDELAAQSASSDKSPSQNWDPNQNHGRHGTDNYAGCPTVDLHFDEPRLVEGKCPSCAECNTDAKLYTVEPKFVVLLDSAPLVSGTRYQLECSRCSVCQQYYTAPLPAHVAGQPKYSHRCRSTIAIYHYYAGIPFKRLEMLQEAQGVPLPDATQYDLMRALYDSVIEPITDTLRRCAANGSTLYFDDTPGRILQQISLNKKASNRKQKRGVHATALLSEYQDHRIYLFDTNTNTAGKQLTELLSDRTSDERFITMSDASPHNFHEMDEALMARWVISLCLAHGRRRFVELLGEGDPDIIFVLDIIGQLYEHERYCKDNQLVSDERLRYHQRHSSPLIGALFIWFNNLLLYKQVEPNSQFGEAIVYMLKRWEWLTQFLHEPGAPLDNNLCEQAVKVMIRYRKNSLFYGTFYGASIGDAMMSVLHTTRHAGVNIFDYLNTLQLHAASVQAEPERWLPWCYRATCREQEQIVGDGSDPLESH